MSKASDEICLQTKRIGGKTSGCNLKHLEKEGRKKCFCLRQEQTSGYNCPALSYLGRASGINPRMPHKSGTPRAMTQTPSGESQGRQVWGWVAKQPSPLTEKFLLVLYIQSRQRPGAVLK